MEAKITQRNGEAMTFDASFRLYSLVDGKQPLPIWLFLPALKYITDPLVAGRLVSIGMGFVGMVGFGVLGWYMSKSKAAGLFAALLYLFSPFFLTYDRMALYEATLVACSVWALFFTMLLVRTVRLDVALILGMVIGAGLLTKSSAQFSIYLLPARLLLFYWKKKDRTKRLAQWLLFAGIASVFAYASTFVLRLSPFHHIINEKNHTFIYTYAEFFAAPFQAVFGNLRGLGSWLVSYITVPLVAVLGLGILRGLHKQRNMTLYLLVSFVVPFAALAFFGRVIYPRFLTFMTIPLYMIIAQYFAFLWYKKWSRYTFLAIFIVAFGYAWYFDGLILFNPVKAPFPFADRQQFINDWPSGYGVAEATHFFQQESEKGKIIVGTEGTFGLFPYAFELYLKDNTNVKFKALWPVENVPEELLQDAVSYPTYLVFKERQEIPSHWPLKLVAEYQRGDGPTYMRVFQVIPPQT